MRLPFYNKKRFSYYSFPFNPNPQITFHAGNKIPLRKSEMQNKYLNVYDIICGKFLVNSGIFQVKECRDPGSDRGPLDLQSNAFPTELSRHVPINLRL